MSRRLPVMSFLIACIGLVFAAAKSSSVPVEPDKAPEAVMSTFKALFPNGEIQKLDAEEEDGIMVYDFEFKAGERDKEADIAGDGTMMESTLVVTPAEVPPAAMKTIKKVAKDAKIGRMEWIETFYKAKDSKLSKLAKSEIHYAAELWRGEQMAEVFVNPAGKVTEAPVWPKTTKKSK